MKNLILLLMIFLSFRATSQNLGNSPKRVYRIITENDFWRFKNKTDIYYTQGLKIECLQSLNKNSKFSKWWPFLLKFNTQNIQGIGFGQNLYTSTDIRVPTIMEGDRPYSAWFYVSKSTVSNNEITNRRLSADLYLGVIGPAALGEEIQRWWHQIIKSPDPKGWPNQIKNDLGINLSLKYERGLYSYYSKDITIDFVPNIELQVGSVFNIASIGTTARVSLFNSTTYFKDVFGQGSIPKMLFNNYNSKSKKRISFLKSFKLSNISVFTSNSASLVLYNSLLQGGLFSQNSPYLISNSDIERVYVNINYGITYSNPYFSISYSQAFRTREFNQQDRNHQWGRFQVLLKI